MAQPFIGEIRIFSFNFPPRGWATCSGQLLAISQNQALFSILGTTFGGDGRVTFALPDLRGRTPVHAVGGTTVLGQQGGVEAVALSANQLPAHTHGVNASGGLATATTPAGNVMAAKARFGADVYTTAAADTLLAPGAVGAAGATGQAHDNMQPSLVMNPCIALFGVFPSRN